MEILAINGGRPVRESPMPPRSLIGNEEKTAVMKILDQAVSEHGTIGYNGPYEQEYERGFAQFMGGGFCDGVNSGTNALFVALGALGLDALSEVIVPAIDDAGGIMPVLFAGCVPVIADTEPGSYNTSAEQISLMITERTKAVIVAHIGGEPIDMAPVIELVEKHGLLLIEDCAQAQGAICRGRKVGTFGNLATFSTMFSKHHCTGGQGGIVYTKQEEMYWRIKRFADRGKPFNMTGVIDGVHNVVAGLNCNSNDLAAAIGLEQLQKLPDIINKRQYIGETLKSRLKNECRTVTVGWQAPETSSSYWFLRCRLDLDAIKISKNEFCEALKKEGIPVSASYRYIPCENPWFVNKSVFGQSGFPWNCSDYHGDRNPSFKLDNAIEVTDTNFNIAINENYEEQEIEDIISAIQKVETQQMGT